LWVTHRWKKTRSLAGVIGRVNNLIPRSENQDLVDQFVDLLPEIPSQPISPKVEPVRLCHPLDHSSPGSRPVRYLFMTSELEEYRQRFNPRSELGLAEFVEESNMLKPASVLGNRIQVIPRIEWVSAATAVR